MKQPSFSLNATMALNETHYPIETLLESSTLGFFMIRFPNTFTLSIRDRSREDFVGLQSSHYDDFIYQIHPDDRARVNSRFHAAEFNEVISTLLFRLLPHGSDEILWLRAHFHGLPTGEILGLFEDISQLKYHGFAYQSVQKRLNTAIDSARMGAWEWFADGNRVFLYGFLFDELGLHAPKRPFDIALVQKWVHPHDYERVLTLTKKFWESPIGSYRLEFRIKGKDNKWIWVRLIGQVFLFKGDRPSRMNGIIQDITEERTREQLKTLLKIGNVGYFEYYPDRKEPLYFDTISRQMLGLDTNHPKPETIIKRIQSPRAALIFEDLTARIHVTADTLFSYQFALQLPREKRFMQLECISRRNPQGEAYLEGFLIDQTEKRKNERVIRENQKLFDQITQYSPIGILLLDDRGYVQYINHDAATRFEYPRTGIVHHHLTEFIHPELLPKLFHLLDKAHKTKPSGLKERLLFVAKTGTRLWMDLTISYIEHNEGNQELLILMEDITEKIKNQQSMIQLEQKYLFLFQETPVALGIFNFNSEALVINNAFTELLGYSKAELIGKRFEDLTLPDEKENFQKMYQTLFEGTAQHYLTQKSYLHKDGTWISVDINLKRADDGLNEPVVIATIRPL
jgi:PAS domain S-box-containing protein